MPHDECSHYGTIALPAGILIQETYNTFDTIHRVLDDQTKVTARLEELLTKQDRMIRHQEEGSKSRIQSLDQCVKLLEATKNGLACAEKLSHTLHVIDRLVVSIIRIMSSS